MELNYKITDDTIEVTGVDLTSYRHKKSVYLGSFYVKELRESNKTMIADYEDGDRPLIFYRDSLHDMHAGWKTPLVELVASFVKVAYLVSRGVIYQPFEDPDNYIYNIKKHRVQIVGRKDITMKYLDEQFLDWVLEMIGFIISKEDKENFGYLAHQDYFYNMDEAHQDLYKGYLQQKDFKAIVEYALEPSVIEVLDQYTPISRLPIDNNPTISDVLGKSLEEKQAQMKKEQEERERVKKEKEKDLERQQREVAELNENSKKKLKSAKRSVKSKKGKEKPKSKVKEKVKIEEFRNQLGIPDDKETYGYKRKGSNIIPTVLSLLLLAVAIWLAWTFFGWIL